MKFKLLIVLLFVVVGTVYGAEMAFVDAPYTTSLNGYNYVFSGLGYFKMSDNQILNITLIPIGLHIHSVSDTSNIYTVSVPTDEEGDALSYLSLRKFDSESLVFNKNFSVSSPVNPELSIGNNVNIAFYSYTQNRIEYMQTSKTGAVIENITSFPSSKSDLFSWYSTQYINLTNGSTETLSFQPENVSMMRIRVFEYNEYVNISSNKNGSRNLVPPGLDIPDVNGQNVKINLTALEQNETVRVEVSYVPQTNAILLPYGSDLIPYKSWPQIKVLSQDSTFSFYFFPTISPTGRKLNVSADINISLPYDLETETISSTTQPYNFHATFNITNQSGLYNGSIKLNSTDLFSEQNLFIFVDSQKPVIENLDVDVGGNVFVNVSVLDDSLILENMFKPSISKSIIRYNYTLIRNGNVVSNVVSNYSTHEFSGLPDGNYNITVQAIDGVNKISQPVSRVFTREGQISITNVECENNGLTIYVRNEGDEIIGTSELIVYRIYQENEQQIDRNFVNPIPPSETMVFRTGAPCIDSQIAAEYYGSYTIYNYTQNITCSIDLDYIDCEYNSSEEIYFISMQANWQGGAAGRFRWDPNVTGSDEWSYKENPSHSFSGELDSTAPSNTVYFDVLSDRGVECSNNIVVHCVTQTERDLNMSYTINKAAQNFMHAHFFFTDIFGGRLYQPEVEQLVENSASISEDISGTVQVSHGNTTQITVFIDYNGPGKDYVILLQNLSKRFAQNISNIIVQTPGDVFVIEEDPEYAIIFGNVSSGEDLEVSYYSDEVKNINASDVENPMLFVYDVGPSITTSTTSTSSTTTFTTTTTTSTTTTTYETTTTSYTTTTYTPPQPEEGGFPIFLIIIVVILVVIGIIVYMFKEHIIFFFEYMMAR